MRRFTKSKRFGSRVEKGNQQSKSRLFQWEGRSQAPHTGWRRSSPSWVMAHFRNSGDKEKTSQTSREKNHIPSKNLELEWLYSLQSQSWEQEDSRAVLL